MDDFDDEDSWQDVDGEIHVSTRAQQQREYIAAYPEFLNTLTPRERRHLREQGFDQPDLDTQQINGKRHSADELNLAEKHRERHDQKAVITRVLLELSGRENLRLHLDVMLSALGVYDHEGVTLEELGEKHGCSKQRFGELRTAFIDAYDLPPPQNGRGIQQRNKESKTRCQKNNSPSISQMKSASYTPALQGRRSPCSRPQLQLAKS